MKSILRCGLIGETLRHSYSKQIHGVLAPYEYEHYGVTREAAAQMIKSGEFSGLNVTIPYKELAFSLCDELDETAQKAKSVNTIIYRDGKICGYNTDVFGFISMVERANITFSGKNVVILGSGGTSKTAYLASETMGAKSITVVSRKGEVNYQNVYDLTDTEIIVNTTPVGMYPKNGISPVELSRFPKCEGVVDVIYNPRKTKLVFDAEALGIPCISGLHMLAAQAFRAAELFTGNPLDPCLIDKAVSSVAKSTENIILIGMPGSGKSTVGKCVASLCGREFVDTDEIIERRFGAPADIIKAEGEETFRRIETEVLSEVGKEKGQVISTGGGVVEREENLPLLSQNGKIYLILRDIDKLETANRPLSKDIAALYARRREKYLRFADKEIENNETANEAAKKLVDDFEA